MRALTALLIVLFGLAASAGAAPLDPTPLSRVRPPRPVSSSDLAVLHRTLVPLHSRYDPEVRMLRQPFSSPGYHTTLTHGTVHATRDSLRYAVACLDAADPALRERALGIVDRVLDLQDQDPQSPTCGVWPWFLEEPLRQMAPPDYNWADFCGVLLLQIALDHSQACPAPLLQRIESALLRAAECIRKRNVGPGYTNIALMGAYVTLLAGEKFQRPDLREYGQARLKRFYEHTLREGGFTEYNSPTYTIVALEELGRLRSDLDDPGLKPLIEELYRLAWEEVAWHFHVPSRQWAGPHSRAYSDLLSREVLAIIQRATEGRTDFQSEPNGLLAHRPVLPCPIDLEHHFRSPAQRTLVRTLQQSNPMILGVTHMTPQFALASCSLADFWNQRRPILAHWQTPRGPAWFRVRMLRDGYDFAAAQLVAAQDTDRLLAGIAFATDGGQRHVSLDRMTNALTTASDLRLRLEWGGAAKDIKPRRPTQLHQTWKARSGLITFEGSVASVRWPLGQPVWESSADAHSSHLDLVLLRGKAQTIDFARLNEASLLLALRITTNTAAWQGPEVSTNTDVTSARWAGLQLEWPAKPVKTADFRRRSQSQRPPSPEVTWDVQSDTWVATDDLGRSLPTSPQASSPRPGKNIGIFYFLWLGRHGHEGPFDISRILSQAPQAIQDPQHPLWGPMHAPHHWGESIFGYYVSEDEAVLAKHAQMLTDAGVDAVVFDVTNQLTYPESWKPLCRVWDRIRRTGQKVPRLIFLCPFWDPAKVVRELYRDLYAPGLYRELWFRWESKPLILADPALLRKAATNAPAPDIELEAIFNTFTFRKPQPDYFRGPTGPDQWGWLEVHPQHAFTNRAGVVEEATVGVAQNAVDGKLSVLSNPRSHGRSFHLGAQPSPDRQDYSGRNFTEQWSRAASLDPAFIFVTGWNEWIAGRFTQPSGFYGDGPVTFVDQFNREYSRDIEPMRGGHGDVFYYQLAAAVRTFKGLRPIPALHSRPIRVDGTFQDWVRVEPEFRDTIADPVQRDAPGWNRRDRYQDNSGRNDIVAAKVSYDRQSVFFYVRTRDPLTSPSGPRWMQLYIDADGNATNGWCGYDFVVNRQPPVSECGRVESHCGPGYQWEARATAPLRFAGNELELQMTWKQLRLAKPPPWLDFKWADNAIREGVPSEFTLHGDAAPNDRFNYRATLR